MGWLRNSIAKLKLLYMLDLDADEGTIHVGSVRMFLPPVRVLSATRDRVIDIGPAGQRFMYEAGEDAGHEYADAIEDLGVDITSAEEFVEMCEAFGTTSGWGKITVTAVDLDGHTATVEIANTMFRSEEDEKVCEYHAGMLAGAAERILGTAMDAKEVACMNQGADACVFELREEGELDGLFN